MEQIAILTPRALAAPARDRRADRNEAGALGRLAAAGLRRGGGLGPCADRRSRPPPGRAPRASRISPSRTARCARSGRARRSRRSSMVVDRSGIYYDGRPAFRSARPRAPIGTGSRLRSRLGRRRAADLLRRLQLSKYNSGPERTPGRTRPRSDGAERRVLVLDQVRDDASIARRARRCRRLPDDACRCARRRTRQPRSSSSCIPTSCPAAARLFLASLSQAGGSSSSPSRSIRGRCSTRSTRSTRSRPGSASRRRSPARQVVTFGSPFYAGWGFTDDRGCKLRAAASASSRWSSSPPTTSATRAISTPIRGRRSASSRPPSSSPGCATASSRSAAARSATASPAGSGRTVDRMLDGPAGPPLHTRDVPTAVALAQGEQRPRRRLGVARHRRARGRACREAGIELVRVEDGFVRSAGLGASFVLPLSLVFDGRGIYYDSRAPSDLEVLLEEGEFPPALLERARRLREKLVAARHDEIQRRRRNAMFASRAAAGRSSSCPARSRTTPRSSGARRVVKRNIDLLDAVRARHPDGFIVYKPHPDVEAGFRRGRVPREDGGAIRGPHRHERLDPQPDRRAPTAWRR